MNIFDRIKGALGLGPKLRNKPGGYAWIRGVDTQNGDSVMNGRAVQTVRLDETGLWLIDPPQQYKLTRSTHFEITDTRVSADSIVVINGLADEYLEPWKDDAGGVSNDEVRKLYEPSYGRPLPIYTARDRARNS